MIHLLFYFEDCMRLMYFIPFLSAKGGLERTLIDKANWLVEKGHEVLFATFENDGPIAYPLNEKVRHVDFACPFFRIYQLPFYLRFHAVLKIKRIFRHKMKETISAFRPNVIVVAIPLSEFFLHDLVRTVGNTPVIVESHLAYGYEPIARGLTEKILDFFYPPLNSIRKTKLLVALTKRDASKWQNCHQRICVIPNPLTFYPTQLHHLERKAGRILCVGRLALQKRYDRMINAFAKIADKYPNWYVDIYGGGQEQVKIELNQLINTKGLAGRIKINAPVGNIYTEYQRSQFLVLSSDYEGFGLVIVEAMACGLPVVSTDCPFGPSEIIEVGKNGLLAKMEVADLAEKIEWMIVNEDERKQMGCNAYKAAARYRKDEIMPLWEKAYLSVIQ